MEKLNAYELVALLKFWTQNFDPVGTSEMAPRVLEIATALKARMDAEHAK